ncbi:MAG: hypothetical protein LBS96_01020, partial [Oscillospiraceae bacterium]|nr:hypothetical protein [Oscillospiraceae bacterium]
HILGCTPAWPCRALLGCGQWPFWQQNQPNARLEGQQKRHRRHRSRARHGHAGVEVKILAKTRLTRVKNPQLSTNLSVKSNAFTGAVENSVDERENFFTVQCVTL